QRLQRNLGREGDDRETDEGKWRELENPHRFLIPVKRVAPGHDARMEVRRGRREREFGFLHQARVAPSFTLVTRSVTLSYVQAAASPRYAARTAGSCSSDFASPESVISPDSIT